MKPLNYAELKNIQKMTLNQANRWIKEVYAEAYTEGQKAGMQEIEVVGFDPDDLKAYLQTIPRIGEKTSQKILDALLEYDKWEG